MLLRNGLFWAGLFFTNACAVCAQTQFTPIRVRCGGPSYVNSTGQLWNADTGYSGGVATATAVPIRGASDQPLYQTARSWTDGSEAYYDFDLPNGTYAVTLKFAETSVTQPGQRVFNMFINGQSVFQNFDIYAAAGGANSAVDKQYVVAVADQQLEIEFDVVMSVPMISAIQIVSAVPQAVHEVASKFSIEADTTYLSLPDTPIVGTVRVYLNGLLMSDTDDFMLSDNKLAFNAGQLVKSGDIVQVVFEH